MEIRKSIYLIPLFFIFLIEEVKAHCPLCTAGAAVAVGGAAWIGVNEAVIGLFIGAFAISTGWWVSKLIKKKYIPYQTFLIIISSFLLTVIPLLKIAGGKVFPIYISLIGGYGTLLNRTYIMDLFLSGSFAGGLIVSITPWLSKRIAKLRGDRFLPFQGVIITMILLIIGAVIIQSSV